MVYSDVSLCNTLSYYTMLALDYIYVKLFLEFKLLNSRRIYGIEHSHLEGKNTNKDFKEKSN